MSTSPKSYLKPHDFQISHLQGYQNPVLREFRPWNLLVLNPALHLHVRIIHNHLLP
jgi:hypothetical protein